MDWAHELDNIITRKKGGVLQKHSGDITIMEWIAIPVESFGFGGKI